MILGMSYISHHHARGAARSRSGFALVLAATLISCGPHQTAANASALVATEVGILDQDALEELRADFLEVSGSDRIAFAAGSAQLTAKARFQLERQALWLTANDNVSIRLRSESASPKGIDQRRLALRRAEAVRSFLKDVGVGANQIVGLDIEYGNSDTVSTLIDKFHSGKPDARKASAESHRSQS